MPWLNLCIINLTPLVTHSFSLKTCATCQGFPKEYFGRKTPTAPSID